MTQTVEEIRDAREKSMHLAIASPWGPVPPSTDELTERAQKIFEYLIKGLNDK